MLAELLYLLWPYQIFKSVLFRAGLTFLTTYVLINWILPKIIRLFRRQGITSDFSSFEPSPGPYRGATPIMGGLVLIPAILVSMLLWVRMNQYTLALMVIMLSFALIGAIDDGAKVLHKRRIQKGLEQKKSFADKADGISGKLRLGLEIAITLGVILAMSAFSEGVDGHLHIPGVPLKTWLPELPTWLMIPFVTLVIVGGANAVNLTDGLDSLATVPIMTCTLFAASAAYVAGDLEWSDRLKLMYVSGELKEVTVVAVALLAACTAFLRYNSPPASIYMGDVGSLGLGAAVCSMFVFVKAELFLPIIGASFVIAALSTIIQRLWFKLMLKRKGRDYAQENRFFYRAPYHHHVQHLLTYREQPSPVRSLWHEFMLKLGLDKIEAEDQYLNKEEVNNKVIWGHHLRAVALLVVTLMIYFKVR